MRITNRIIALIVTITMILTSTNVWADGREVKIVSFDGEVNLLQSGGEKTFEPQIDMLLEEGTAIVTGKDSQITLSIDGNKEVIIDEKSFVNIEELREDEEGEKTGFRLLVGKIWSNIKTKLGVGESYEIRTPNSVMGARGTKYFVTYEQETPDKVEETDLVVVEGTVAVKGNTSKKSQDEKDQVINITAGNSINMEAKNPGQDKQLLPIATDLSKQDIFVLNTILADLKKNPQEYIEGEELKKDIEEFKPEAQRRELKEDSKVIDHIKAFVDGVKGDEDSKKKNKDDDGDTEPDDGDTEPDDGDTEPDDGDTEPDDGDTEPDDGDTEPDDGDTSVPPTINISETSVTLILGELGRALNIEVNDPDAIGYKWLSTDTTVVSVNSEGYITQLGVGNAIVKAVANDGSVSDGCSVVVEAQNTNRPVTSMAISQSDIDLYIGGSTNLLGQVEPSNASDQKINWLSSNPSVVMVDSVGTISALKEGVGIITATSNDGKYTDTCQVRVSPILVERIDMSESTIQIDQGESRSVSVQLEPANATNQKVIWTSSDSSVVSINSDGEFTGVSPGIAQVSVTTDNGLLKDSCQVIVKAIVTKVESVSLNTTSKVVEKGEVFNLVASIMPVDASNKSLLWQSSNNGVLSVDEAGKVTALGVGNGQIWATSVDGDKRATVDVTVEEISVTSVSLVESSIALDFTSNASYELTYDLFPQNADNINVSWSVPVQYSSYITVTDQGRVSSLATTSAALVLITTEDGGYIDQVEVSVNQPVVDVTSISVAADLSLIIGTTADLPASVSPLDATNKNVVYSSSNESVAVVTQSGVVSARGKGTAVITVTSQADASLKGESQVIVLPVKTESLAIIESLSLVEGDQYQLVPQVTPTNATDQKVNYSSSDENVAIVSADGLITAVASGDVIISVVSNDGHSNTQSNVVVVPRIISVDGVTILSSKELIVGEIENLVPEINPINATDQRVNWVSNSGLVTVDNNGRITGIAPGAAKVTVTTLDGNFSAICDVVVKPIEVTAVNFVGQGRTMDKEETYEVIYQVEPTNATVKTVTWISSDESVATVNTSGLITAVGPGDAVIKATTANGKYDEFTVHVDEILPVSIALTIENHIIILDQEQTFSGVVMGDGGDQADNQTLVWSSENESIATVVDGLVTGISKGETTLYATSIVNGIQESVDVVIVERLESTKLEKIKSFDKDEDGYIDLLVFETKKEVIAYNEKAILTNDILGNIVYDVLKTEYSGDKVKFYLDNSVLYTGRLNGLIIPDQYLIYKDYFVDEYHGGSNVLSFNVIDKADPLVFLASDDYDPLENSSTYLKFDFSEPMIFKIDDGDDGDDDDDVEERIEDTVKIEESDDGQIIDLLDLANDTFRLKLSGCLPGDRIKVRDGSKDLSEEKLSNTEYELINDGTNLYWILKD